MLGECFLCCCLLLLSSSAHSVAFLDLMNETTPTSNSSAAGMGSNSSVNECTQCPPNRVCVIDKSFIVGYKCCKANPCVDDEGLFCVDLGEVENATRIPPKRGPRRNFDPGEAIIYTCKSPQSDEDNGKQVTIDCKRTGRWSMEKPNCNTKESDTSLPDWSSLVPTFTNTSTGPKHVDCERKSYSCPSHLVCVVDEMHTDGYRCCETETCTGDPVEKPSSSQTVVVIIGVTCVCLLIVAIGAWILRRRYKQRCGSDYEMTGRQGSVCYTPPFPQPSSFKNGAVSAEDFVQYVAIRHSNNDQRFIEEFEEIQNWGVPRITWEASMMSENKDKNRYTNIVAYDHSRVRLHRHKHGQRNSDYINANYVSGYCKPKAYIACQGPLPSTFCDFWKMVWDNNTATIVMITNLVEKGRRKCDQYWPQEGKEQYKHISVTLKRTESFANYTVRTFSIKNTKLSRRNARGGERRVLQFHFTEWPDHGTPEYLLPVLTFIRRSFGANPSHAGPIVIHCSAGVGRTGTYIVIHSMIQMLQATGSINIKEYLRHIRLQRNHLVQTEDQYVFVHDALLEYIMSGNTECSLLQLAPYYGNLTAPTKNIGNGTQTSVDAVGDVGRTVLRSGFEKQVMKVVFSRSDLLDCDFALRSVNERKNRPSAVLPVFRSRVPLCNRTSAEGSDYINASFVQGYRSSHEFIVTQLPLPNTKNDFWQLIWDHNCPTIVTIMDEDWNPDVDPYWPTAEKPFHCNSFNVSFGSETIIRSEEDGCDLVTREFILEATKDDYVLEVRQFQLSGWDKERPTLAQLKAVGAIVKHTSSKDGSTVVQDKLGSTAAAQLACWHCMQYQLDNENAVDVYQTAVVTCQMRPRVFTDPAHLKFLYEAVLLEAQVRSNSSQAKGDSKALPSKDGGSPNGVHFNNSAIGNSSLSDITETDKLMA